jgi:AraC-like DNA-binding protein
MPIYMDIHQVPGAEARDLAEAHSKDLLIQDEFQCKCITYWLDESRGSAFCLIEAPNASAVTEIHRKSHGFVPNKVIEVRNDIVESFLGRIHDPEDAVVLDNGLKMINDPAFRFLLVTDITDPVILKSKLGAEKTNEWLNRQNKIIRKEISAHKGREVEYAGTGFIVSFSSAEQAVQSALAILQGLAAAERSATGFKIAIHAGEPISKSDQLFGDIIQLAKYLCTVSNHDQIVISTTVKELLARDFFMDNQEHILTPAPQDETLMESLFNILEKNWQDSDFTIEHFCRKMSMSKSQLYRKTTTLWNLAPNALLQEFRLIKAKGLLKNHSGNIAQTTFDSGFTSPSYFTKCFKKKFGLLPAGYLNARS